MMMYSDSSVSFKGLINGIMSTCVSVVSSKSALAAASTPTRPVTFQAFPGYLKRRSFETFSPCSASKCHAGIGVTVMSGCASRIESRKRSVTKSSEGAMRATSLSNCASVTSVAKKSPLLSVNHTKPHFASRPAGRETASKTASFFRVTTKCRSECLA